MVLSSTVTNSASPLLAGAVGRGVEPVHAVKAGPTFDDGLPPLLPSLAHELRAVCHMAARPEFGLLASHRHPAGVLLPAQWAQTHLLLPDHPRGLALTG